MSQFFKLFLTSAIVFLIFDLFWLLVVSKKMYQHFIGQLMGELKLAPAGIFYVLYGIGVVFSYYYQESKNRVFFIQSVREHYLG